MYIEAAVLTVFCLWFTDKSCFGCTRPSVGVHFSSWKSVYASHPVGPMCPRTLSRSFHMQWNSKLTVWNSKTQHMYTYFCLGGASQKLLKKQCYFTQGRRKGFCIPSGLRSFDSSVTAAAEILEVICRNEKYVFLYIVR